MQMAKEGQIAEATVTNDRITAVTEGGSRPRKKLQAILDSMPSEGLKIYRPPRDPMEGRG